MRNERIKIFIVLAFVALVIYWGLTGFSVTANWVALVGPIILGYLFRPPSDGNGDRKAKNGNVQNKQGSTSTGVDNDSLCISNLGIHSPLFSGQV